MKSRPSIGAGLMLMSVGSGYIDILSYRFLGEVFPSAMTGNVALMGLSLGQGDVSAAIRNLCALGAFFSGVVIGALILRDAPGRGRFLLTLGLQALMLLGFSVLWDQHAIAVSRYGLIGLAAMGMGLQSSVAHRIGVTGVSTTYFTGTLTNIAFRLVDPHAAGTPGRRVGLPVAAFLSYLSGAAIGGWSLSGRVRPDLPIGMPALPLVATVILAIIIATVRSNRPNAA